MALFSEKIPLSIPLWRQIQKNNFTKIAPLLDYLELSLELREKILIDPKFPLNLPQRLAAKIEKNTLEDPILRQFVPLKEELIHAKGFSFDPVQDLSFQKTKKILHKYEKRALLLSTSACAMHCRYCFRQNFPYETTDKNFENEIAYLKQNSSISEIILSGGDPLSLANSTLCDLFNALKSIPHLKRIRFHTRFPIGIPERLEEDFLKILEDCSQQIFFILHTNHPKELDSDLFFFLKKIQRLGIPILNQSVLLKGVNDEENTLLLLMETLINEGVIPYYLHRLDPVQGASHFALPQERGIELIQFVQAKLSGFGVPRLVQEEAGMTSKTFIL